jgi:hypothetical protein
MGCHITGVYDVNRNTTLDNDNYELVRDWAESVATHKIQGIIFHNSFTPETCEKYKNECIPGFCWCHFNEWSIFC